MCHLRTLVIAVQTAHGEELVRYPSAHDAAGAQGSGIGVLNYALTQVVEQGTAKGPAGLDSAAHVSARSR